MRSSELVGGPWGLPVSVSLAVNFQADGLLLAAAIWWVIAAICALDLALDFVTSRLRRQKEALDAEIEALKARR